MTASVDFTTLVRAGRDAGLGFLGLITQAEFLAALGIGDALALRPDPRASWRRTMLCAGL